MSRDIDLHIDRLVLDGVPAAQRGPIEEALRRELSRLLATAPPYRAQDVTRVDAGALAINVDESPEVIGHRLAGLLHARLLLR